MSSVASAAAAARPGWAMPLVPEDFDRRPLTPEERRALALPYTTAGFNGMSRAGRTAADALARLYRPLEEVSRLSAVRAPHARAAPFLRVMRREMHRRGTAFWAWSPAEWRATLGASAAAFLARHGAGASSRHSVALAAYLFGGVTDLRPVGTPLVPLAKAAFGAARVAAHTDRLHGTLQELGYSPGKRSDLQLGLCTLLLLGRSPHLEDIAPETLAGFGAAGQYQRQVGGRLARALGRLGLLPPGVPDPPAVATPPAPAAEGMSAHWHAWVLAWYDQALDLVPKVRQGYLYRLLKVGRWLHAHAPEVQAPEQWTEELALRLRRDLLSWTSGDYVSERGRRYVRARGVLTRTLSAQAVQFHLVALRRFFLDLARRAHAVDGAPARRLRLDFLPHEVFATPKPIRRKLDEAAPRDIDQRHWAKLTIAAATLAAADLPPGHQYPLSFYRAVGLLWVTSARRPNELRRLRLDCVRRDWDPAMRDDEGQPLPAPAAGAPPGDEEARPGGATLCYLHVPSGKNRGPFWIWIPDYVADAVDQWQAERPREQQRLRDEKDEEAVAFLFTHRDRRVGIPFINTSLIPLLCRKAGVDPVDAKGRITGHRGRSTRLTLLRRNGVGLEDLAAYAGHANTNTIRRYANQDPLQLHRTIQAADDLSRSIEGLVDLAAAARGLPALRWFLGHDADGAPMYCANQAYHTCPHRLDCVKCGMFIGGEKARLLHTGEGALPVSATVPTTPVERCLLRDDEAGLAAERAALTNVPPPEPPSLDVVFNPHALSDRALAALAARGTAQALGLLRAAEAEYARLLAEGQAGRSALGRARRERLTYIRDLVATCEAAGMAHADRNVWEAG